MIESIMFFGIGFLVASLLGLVVVPLVHNRAVRLTVRRLEAATPLSMAEIQAEKDQLRAEFAMSTRRLEMSVDQLKAQIHQPAQRTGEEDRGGQPAQDRARREDRGHFCDRGAREDVARPDPRHRAGIRDQDPDHARGRARARRQGGRSRQAHHRARRTHDAVRQPAGGDRRLANPDRGAQGSAQQVRARGQGDRRPAQPRAPRRRCDQQRAERGAHAKSKAWVVASASWRRQLVAQTTEAEILGRRVQDLETRLSEQGRLLVEREYDVTQIRTELENGAQVRERPAGRARRRRNPPQQRDRNAANRKGQARRRARTGSRRPSPAAARNHRA